jgi:hypothetical protein
MDRNLDFNDQVVSKFCYDIDNKKIEVYYSDFWSRDDDGNIVSQNCLLTIENWTSAKSRLGDEPKFYPLDKHIGIFSMIIFTELKKKDLTIIVNTINDTYITLQFDDPQIAFVVL